MGKKLSAFLKSIQWDKIETGTYIRYIVMILLILNTVGRRTGLFDLNVSEDNVYGMASDILTMVMLLVNTWKNNSITDTAIAADKYLKDLNDPNSPVTLPTETPVEEEPVDDDEPEDHPDSEPMG